jgi:hypothetical protein
MGFMFRFAAIFYVTLLGASICVGNILLTNLGASRVPAALVPIANAWGRSGRDPKWIKTLMWILFALTAATFFALILYPLYPSILDLGHKWPN